MRRINATMTIICAVVALLVLGSCDATIHEYPEEPQPFFTLRFSFNDSLPQYKVIETEEMLASSRTDAYRYRRFIVNVFSTGQGRSGERTPDYTYTYVLADRGTGETYDVHPDLPAGTYRFMVWEDISEDGTEAGTYYATANFEEIELVRGSNGMHQGNTNSRDAFRGIKDTLITRKAEEICTIEMQRPLAKYEFITTDLDEFISRAVQQAAKRDGTSGWEQESHGLQTDSISGEQKPGSKAAGTGGVNLDDYRVMFYYPLYMPCSYNMFTDKPADSWTAVSFEGKITKLSDTEAQLGFDYVFVNGTEAMATVGLNIYNKAGEQIATVSALTIPLKRSKLTTVRGKFLTSKAGGSIGIDPTFDGEYNIKIN